MTAPAETRWDQSGFAALKAAWPAARIKEDEKRLKNIFNLAARSPTLKQALVWAEDHGVKFFVDHQAVNCGGYYTPGTGVVALTLKTATGSGYFAVQALTHEIRHAWQDYHGLCPTDYPGPATAPDFAEYFIRLSLIEADAFAFGKRAEDELLEARLREAGIASLVLQANLAAAGAYLRKKFLDWFSTPRTTSYYGDAASKHYARAAGIYHGGLPERGFEFTAETVLPLGSGIDIASTQNILRLGEAFSGQNYLTLLPQGILKKILRPSLALSFYGAANDNQKKLVAEIRKHDLRNKLNLKP